MSTGSILDEDLGALYQKRPTLSGFHARMEALQANRSSSYRVRTQRKESEFSMHRFPPPPLLSRVLTFRSLKA